MPTPTLNTGNTGGGNSQTNAFNSTQFQQAVQQQAQSIANQLLAQRNAQQQALNTGKVFTRFDPVNDILLNQVQTVTAGMFINNTVGTLNTYYSSSIETAQQKRYYYDVYQSKSSATTAAVQFSVAYGNRLGSGSSFNGNVKDFPTQAIYSQYRLMLLDPSTNIFSFNGQKSDQIYAITFPRAQMKQGLNAGNWQLNLAQLSGSHWANNVHTGSHVKVDKSKTLINLIDDSVLATTTATVGTGGTIYNIVSGTIAKGVYLGSNNKPVYYGLVYPDLGYVILNGLALNASASFNSVTGSNVSGDNAFKLFTSISGSVVMNNTMGFTARNQENITSTYYFVRAKNSDYNFSSNPTFTSGSLGQFKQSTFVGDPRVYCSGVGLFSDSQELLAVANLSRPILKSFQNELVLRVKLDF